MRDVDSSREEDAVQVGDGPGRPRQEPDLLRRVAAPAGERRGRVAGPDVPPQDDGGKRETGDGQEVEAHGPQRPQGGARVSLPREDLVSSARHRSQRSGAALVRIGRNHVVRRVRRHVHPTGHCRRAYCWVPAGRGPGWRVRMIEVVPDHRRCVVVGAGLLGLSAAWALTGRGWNVLVLEAAGAPGHERSGSKGDARIFRLGYPEPHYVEMAMLARQHWRDLEAATGRQLLHVTGQVTLGDEAALPRHRRCPRCGRCTRRAGAGRGGEQALSRDRRVGHGAGRTRFGRARSRRMPRARCSRQVASRSTPAGT